MPIRDLFHTKKKYATVKLYKKGQEETSMNRSLGKSEANNSKVQNKEDKKNYDDNIWMKCKDCEEIILIKDFEENHRICSNCGSYGRIGAKERIELIADEGSFVEYDKDIKTENPINFPGYDEKIEKAQQATGSEDAIITGEAKISGKGTMLGVMDPSFMMGSMGSVVGEKITRLVEGAIEKRLPVIIFTASGGARMQEGILSLMQMAKTSAAFSKLSDEGIPYITVLTDPTTGGVTASFAMLGDIILAEPKALIAFAGPRVIEQTIRQKLPEGFQRSEFLLEKGFIDKIVKRTELREVLGDILRLHSVGGEIDG